MSTILIQPIGPGQCRVVHKESGAVLHTDSPPEYGGEGRSFSATDLLAAALGVCITTNIDTVALRHGVPLEAIEVQVTKHLSQSPKRVASLDVAINVQHIISPELRIKLQRAADGCAVHRSLHPDLEVSIRIEEFGAAPRTDREVTPGSP